MKVSIKTNIFITFLLLVGIVALSLLFSQYYFSEKLAIESTNKTFRIISKNISEHIFIEALTASDRPYKKSKTLSESIRIMSYMVKEKHIDPDLFQLFLRSRVYKIYAQRHLQEEQIDEVNIQDYL